MGFGEAILWDRVAPLAGISTSNTARNLFLSLKRDLFWESRKRLNKVPHLSKIPLIFGTAITTESRIKWEEIARNYECGEEEARVRYEAVKIKMGFADEYDIADEGDDMIAGEDVIEEPAMEE
jgi:hypothetical protein